jgi:hypothetical protein
MPYNFAALVLLAASAASQVQKLTLEQHVNSGCPLILEATRAKSSQGSDPTGPPHQLFLKWPRAHAVIKISGVFHGPALRVRTSETGSDIVDGAVQLISHRGRRPNHRFFHILDWNVSYRSLG